MKKKECPSCAMEIDASSKICPICQYEFASFSPVIKWMAIALVIFFLYLIFR